MMTRRIYVGLVCMLLLALIGSSMAQTATTGQIAGTVTDPSGAVVPGAKITLTNDAGVSRDTTSDGTGHYVFPALPPGKYKMSIAAANFGAVKVSEVNVRITETATVDVPLKVLGTNESVEVTAQPALVQAESATVGRVIDQSQIRQLPLPTRNFTQLLALTPGASGSLTNSSELGRGDAVISVNGNRSTSNSVVINGVDAGAVGTGATTNLAVPATDAMQEFIVQTSLYDASTGRSTGGVIAAVTKSGTNAFHGNMYEFFRSDSLNANNFFLKKQGTARPDYERNQFGGTIGGPGVKDRLWFFTSYQGTRETNGASLLNSLSTINVPGNLGNDRSHATLQALSATWGAFGWVDAAAEKILNAKLPNGNYLIPAVPTGLTGCNTASGVTCAVTIPTTSKFTEDQFNGNLDFKATNSNTVSAKFFWANNPTTQGLYSFAGTQNALQSPGAPTSVYLKNRVLSVGDTWILSPRMINDVKLGFNFITVDSNPSEPLTATDFGMANPLGSLFTGAPTITIFNNADFGPSPLSANFSQNKTWTISDMVTWTHGKHNLKFGGEYKRQGVNLRFDAYTRGQLYYLDASPTLKAWGTFIGGLPTATIIGSGDPYRAISANDFAFFVQDDWRVSNRLTINLGMRWDAYGPFTEEKGRFVALDLTKVTTTPIAGGVAATAGLIQAGNGNLAGIPKGSEGLIDRDMNNFGPRIGFAFRPYAKSDSLVIRGGYGVYYDRMNSRLFNSQVFNSPYYTVGLSVVQSPLGFLINTADPFFHVPLPSNYPLNITNAAQYPYGGLPAVMTRTGVLNALGGAGTTTSYTTAANVPTTGIYPDIHNFVTPFVQQYNLGIQWEAKKNLLLDVSFVGASGQKLTRQRNMNQAATPGVNGPLYPAFSTLSTAPLGTFAIQTSGKSSYNSLQTALTKRYSNGLQLMASYTWSHSIDNYSGGAVNDLVALPGDTTKNYFASSDFDRTHRFVVSYVYDLPKFYKGGNGAVKRIVNNWEIAGITTAQTGTPFGIFDASFFKNVWGDLVTGRTLESAERSGSAMDRYGAYFDTTAFKAPSGVGNWGSVPRNYFRGPGQINFDFSVVKFIPITETQKVEFRTEFFNIFNHTNLANPVNLVSSPNFGKILTTSTGPRVIQFGFKYNF
jgi:hypothetical protein